VATLTEAQVRAIAERTIGGHAEQVVPVLTTAGQSYSVWVDGANGVEVKLVLDARTGKVLSKVSDPQESPDPADSADPTDSPDSTDSPGVGSAAAEATQAPDAQGGSGG
jgi:hypothetical protein